MILITYSLTGISSCSHQAGLLARGSTQRLTFPDKPVVSKGRSPATVAGPLGFTDSLFSPCGAPDAVILFS